MATVKGGEKLRKALDDIAKQLGEPGTVKVGLLEGATAPNGDSLPMRAALNEYGHGNTPPRPAVRNMIAEKSPEWADALALNLKRNNYNTTRTLALMGEGISGQWKEAYLDLWAPPLSPKTIKKKGFDKPLIEHGDMINAVSWEVTHAGGGGASAAAVRAQLGRVGGASGAASFASSAKSAKAPST